jgi:hypothetical protein
MVRYFYAFIPYAAVGSVVFLSLPWLGLLALFVVALVALPALAVAFVIAPYMLVHAGVRRVRRMTLPAITAPASEPATAALQPTYSITLKGAQR